jgi:hypothetical protein
MVLGTIEQQVREGFEEFLGIAVMMNCTVLATSTTPSTMCSAMTECNPPSDAIAVERFEPGELQTSARNQIQFPCTSEDNYPGRMVTLETSAGSATPYPKTRSEMCVTVQWADDGETRTSDDQAYPMPETSTELAMWTSRGNMFCIAAARPTGDETQDALYLGLTIANIEEFRDMILEGINAGYAGCFAGIIICLLCTCCLCGAGGFMVKKGQEAGS